MVTFRGAFFTFAAKGSGRRTYRGMEARTQSIRVVVFWGAGGGAEDG